MATGTGLPAGAARRAGKEGLEQGKQRPRTARAGHSPVPENARSAPFQLLQPRLPYPFGRLQPGRWPAVRTSSCSRSPRPSTCPHAAATPSRVRAVRPPAPTSPGAAGVTAFSPPSLPVSDEASGTASPSAQRRQGRRFRLRLFAGPPPRSGRRSRRGSRGAAPREPLGRGARRSGGGAPRTGAPALAGVGPGGHSGPRRGASALDPLSGRLFAGLSPGRHLGGPLAAVAPAAPLRRRRSDP